MDIEFFDLLRYEQVEYLTVGEILKLCRSNKEFSTICKSEKLWKYLIYRDFGDIPLEATNPYEKYKQAYRVHKMSDIPVSQVMKEAAHYQVKFDDLKTVLESFGFEKRGNYFVWFDISASFDEKSGSLRKILTLDDLGSVSSQFGYRDDVLSAVESIIPVIVSVKSGGYISTYHIKEYYLDDIRSYYQSLEK